MDYVIHDKIGLVYANKKVISKQRKVVLYLIKQIGANLLRGSSVMNISLPVGIFDKRSLLHVCATDFAWAPYFLEPAFEKSDPLEKMKLVI